MHSSKSMDHFGIRALNDLINRAKPGIFVYLFVWFSLTYALDFHIDHINFFITNSLILLVFVATRLLHYAYHRHVTEDNVDLLHNILVCLILGGALHWGVMSAWVFIHVDMQYAEGPFLIVLAGFAMGGTSTLSISKAVRRYYPMFLFAPAIVIFLSDRTKEGYMYGILISISWIYIYVASGTSQSDYWQAISNHLIAQARAEEMEKLSVTDPLTQLKNRMYFDAEYNKEWQRSARIQSSLSLLMIDLDYFKTHNDTHGHLFGDEVLRKVSSCLKEQAKRPADVVARYGGEEFILMLPNTPEQGASVLAKRIVNAVSNLEFSVEGTPVKVTCSVGVATDYPKIKTDSSTLIKRADEALYEAKEQGRNRFIVGVSESSSNPGTISHDVMNHAGGNA